MFNFKLVAVLTGLMMNLVKSEYLCPSPIRPPNHLLAKVPPLAVERMEFSFETYYCKNEWFETDVVFRYMDGKINKNLRFFSNILFDMYDKYFDNELLCRIYLYYSENTTDLPELHTVSSNDKSHILICNEIMSECEKKFSSCENWKDGFNETVITNLMINILSNITTSADISGNNMAIFLQDLDLDVMISKPTVPQKPTSLKAPQDKRIAGLFMFGIVLIILVVFIGIAHLFKHL